MKIVKKSIKTADILRKEKFEDWTYKIVRFGDEETFLQIGMVEISGVVQTVNGNDWISGEGSRFLAELEVGSILFINGEYFTIQDITSDVTAQVDRIVDFEYEGSAFLVGGIALSGNIFIGYRNNRLIFRDSGYYIDEETWDSSNATAGGKVHFKSYPEVEDEANITFEGYTDPNDTNDTHQIIELEIYNHNATKRHSFKIDTNTYKTEMYMGSHGQTTLVFEYLPYVTSNDAFALKLNSLLALTYQSSLPTTSWLSNTGGLAADSNGKLRYLPFAGDWKFVQYSDTSERDFAKRLSGSGAPTSTPEKVGDIYVDTTNKKVYVATGTSSSTDWTLVN
ncbi:MAG: hypothetical protein ACP6IS_12440 [Candidatus Asgardarchaeia archaeon]